MANVLNDVYYILYFPPPQKKSFQYYFLAHFFWIQSLTLFTVHRILYADVTLFLTEALSRRSPEL